MILFRVFCQRKRPQFIRWDKSRKTSHSKTKLLSLRKNFRRREKVIESEKIYYIFLFDNYSEKSTLHILNNQRSVPMKQNFHSIS